MVHADAAVPLPQQLRQHPDVINNSPTEPKLPPVPEYNLVGPRRASSSVRVQVHFLDDSIAIFRIKPKSKGKWLFEQVCQLLNLIEVDYFGLYYHDDLGNLYWIEMAKSIKKQLCLNLNDPTLYFGVKFYTPDPMRLEDELTRYLFGLQIRRDLFEGQLQCTESQAALMCSYIVQAEIGDYDPDRHADQSYLSQFSLLPSQDSHFDSKVMENHKLHKGQTAAEADFHLLDTARHCEFYGVRLSAARNEHCMPVAMAATDSGILVYQSYRRYAMYSWNEIRKLSFKRKRFLVKLHQQASYSTLPEFLFETRNQCKNFWMRAIEQHTFFHCSRGPVIVRSRGNLFSRGTSFHYTGRTQEQLIDYVRQSLAKRFRIRSNFRSSARGHRTHIPVIIPANGSAAVNGQDALQSLSSFGASEAMQKQLTYESIEPAASLGGRPNPWNNNDDLRSIEQSMDNLKLCFEKELIKDYSSYDKDQQPATNDSGHSGSKFSKSSNASRPETGSAGSDSRTSIRSTANYPVRRGPGSTMSASGRTETRERKGPGTSCLNRSSQNHPRKFVEFKDDEDIVVHRSRLTEIDMAAGSTGPAAPGATSRLKKSTKFEPGISVGSLVSQQRINYSTNDNELLPVNIAALPYHYRPPRHRQQHPHRHARSTVGCSSGSGSEDEVLSLCCRSEVLSSQPLGGNRHQKYIAARRLASIEFIQHQHRLHSSSRHQPSPFAVNNLSAEKDSADVSHGRRHRRSSRHGRSRCRNCSSCKCSDQKAGQGQNWDVVSSVSQPVDQRTARHYRRQASIELKNRFAKINQKVNY